MGSFCTSLLPAPFCMVQCNLVWGRLPHLFAHSALCRDPLLIIDRVETGSLSSSVHTLD